eukprot:5867294-Amphidinium_carterae.1
MVEAFSPDYDPSHMSEPVDDGGENEDEVDAESDGDDAAAASVARQHGAVAKSLSRPPPFWQRCVRIA